MALGNDVVVESRNMLVEFQIFTSFGNELCSGILQHSFDIT